MNAVIQFLNNIVWSYFVLYLCLFGGIFFTLYFGFIQLKSLPHAISLLRGNYDDPNEEGEISHFQALCAALSGTIGLGNIAGVAVAIAIGGPGSVFWIWVIGFFGMATKFIECTLGTYYREEVSAGHVRGGPMYYFTKGLGKKWKPASYYYALFLPIAALGAGNMFQSNQAASILNHYYNVPKIATGLILLVLGAAVIIGGIKRIGQVASKIIPFMCVVYVLGALVICVMNISQLPQVFSIIFHDAFTGSAVVGGSLFQVIMIGVQRAIFSNEAGLGSASIAHAAVKTNYPIREGYVASTGPLIDTLVVCTATAIVIIMSGNFGTEKFQAVGETVTFSPVSMNHTLNWTLTDQNIPENTSIQNLRNGHYALHYDANTSSKLQNIPPISILADDVITDALRFSYFKDKGDLSLSLFSDTHEKLTSLSFSEKENEFVTLINAHRNNTWASVLIEFTPAFKALLTEKGVSTIAMQLTPSSEITTLYVDRYQAVMDVEGVELTTVSFDHYFKGFGSIFITVAVFLFAFSTLITWSYYGETGISFIFGEKYIGVYKLIFVCFTFLGAIRTLDSILGFSDLTLGLLVIPNIIALILLAPKVKALSKDYRLKLKSGDIKRHK